MGRDGGGERKARGAGRRPTPRRTLLHRILNLVTLSAPLPVVSTLTPLASFWRAVCRNFLMSLISLGLLGDRGGGRGEARAGVSAGSGADFLPAAQAAGSAVALRMHSARRQLTL